jgi:hypothetical protein
MNYRTFTALLTCKLCGAELPMAGPMRTIKCRACNGDHLVTPERVADYIYFASQGSPIADELAPTLVQSGHPCPTCGTKVDLGGFHAGLETTIQCKTCSTPITAFPPPAWLRPLLPKLEMIIGGERDASDAPYRTPPAEPAPVACWTIGFESRELQRASDIADDDRRAEEAAAQIAHKRRLAEAEAHDAHVAALAKQANARAARIVAYILAGVVVLGVLMMILR